MTSANTRDLVTRRLRNYGIELDDYVEDHPTKGKMIVDLGSNGRGVNFVPVVSKLARLEEQLLSAKSPTGGPAFAGKVEKWSNMQFADSLSKLAEYSNNFALMTSFGATHGDGFRELRDPIDPTQNQQFLPDGGRDSAKFKSDPVFAIKDSAIDGGSLHVALAADYCNVHVDETICFLTGKAIFSLDTPHHWANDLKFKAEGLFVESKRWDKLAFRRTNYSAIVTGTFLGLYVGNGVLGNAVRGGNGLNLGAAAAPAVLGVAGYLAGRYLPESTLRALDHFSVVLPNSGSNFSSHFGMRFQTDLGDFGPLEKIGLTANMFYDVQLDSKLLNRDLEGSSIRKSWSVSVNGVF